MNNTPSHLMRVINNAVGALAAIEALVDADVAPLDRLGAIKKVTKAVTSEIRALIASPPSPPAQPEPQATEPELLEAAQRLHDTISDMLDTNVIVSTDELDNDMPFIRAAIDNARAAITKTPREAGFSESMIEAHGLTETDEPREPAPWSHYYMGPNAAARITLLNIGECDVCGGEVQEANAVTGCDPESTYIAMGLTKIDVLPPEITVGADGSCACEGCIGEACRDCDRA